MHKISPQYSHRINISNEYRNALMIHITDIICITLVFVWKKTKIDKNDFHHLFYER